MIFVILFLEWTFSDFRYVHNFSDDRDLIGSMNRVSEMVYTFGNSCVDTHSQFQWYYYETLEIEVKTFDCWESRK